MTSSIKLFVVLSFLLFGFAASAVVKEPKTGISFPDKLKKTPLSKLGVRYKGPIKVYAVGQYAKSFMLKMSFNVGAQKMSTALVDALKPRCKNCSKEIDDFQTLLLSGLPNGASKGTQLLFGTGGGKLTVNINDKPIGTIASKPLAAAFEGIYTDKNAVCKMKSVDETATDQDGAFIIDDYGPLLVAVGAIATTTVLIWVLKTGRKSDRNTGLNHN